MLLAAVVRDPQHRRLLAERAPQGQRADDPIVSPAGILTRHSQDQFPDLGGDGRPSRTAFAFEGCNFVFTTDGKRAIGGFSKLKAAFDRRCGVTDLVLHDCRRTARSLMSRAGVDSDHAERCLGHVIGGVRGVYDQHKYLPEMQRAYDALAALIERIANPPKGNVTALKKKPA